MSSVQVRPISAVDTRPLRQAVLRPHQRTDELVYPGDDAPEALHAGAFFEDKPIGVASIHRAAKPGTLDPSAWRLRGMAVLPELRGKGYGQALLNACIDHAVRNGGSLVWCNARVASAGFYRRCGFEVEGEAFQLMGIGPHYLMWRKVRPSR